MIAKAAGLELVKANNIFREQAEVSISMKLSKHQIIDADEKVMTIVLKGKQSDHLGTMIYQRFQELVMTGKKPIHPKMLPPKCAATKHHSLRVFHQVQQRQGGILCRLEIWVGRFVEQQKDVSLCIPTGSSSRANDLANALTHELCN